MPAGDRATVVAVAAVVLILLVTLASGPLVGSVTFTRERITAMDVTPGNATVANVSLPETVTLAYRGDGRYAYSGTPARVTFASIRGGDVQLTFGVSVADLNVSRAVTTVTDGSDSNTAVVEFYDTVAGAPPNRSSYEGLAFVTMISQGETRVIARQRVAVSVTNVTSPANEAGVADGSTATVTRQARESEVSGVR